MKVQEPNLRFLNRILGTVSEPALLGAIPQPSMAPPSPGRPQLCVEITPHSTPISTVPDIQRPTPKKAMSSKSSTTGAPPSSAGAVADVSSMEGKDMKSVLAVVKKSIKQQWKYGLPTQGRALMTTLRDNTNADVFCCILCGCLAGNPVVTGCSHVFCSGCFETWKQVQIHTARSQNQDVKVYQKIKNFGKWKNQAWRLKFGQFWYKFAIFKFHFVLFWRFSFFWFLMLRQSHVLLVEAS